MPAVACKVFASVRYCSCCSWSYRRRRLAVGLDLIFDDRLNLRGRRGALLEYSATVVLHQVVTGPEAARDLSVRHERGGRLYGGSSVEAEEKRRLLLLDGEISMLHV